ncbi:P pilus assembly chaperone PapD [Rhodanobacter sp. TND4EL1]
MKHVLLALCVGILVSCLCVTATQATVVIGGTRVVFPAQRGEVTVRLSNVGNSPALIEAWIDSGNPQSTPDNVESPFLITPPLFRIEANKDQSLRILAASPQLPADRESLFWLNVLEVPPKPTNSQAAGKNMLQFAVRSRLKLFYRPAKLVGDALKAAGQLTWQAHVGDQKVSLDTHNNSPFYITISKLSLQVNGKQYTASSGMVAPFSDLQLTVEGLANLPASGTTVTYTTINDYGAADAHQGAVTP